MSANSLSANLTAPALALANHLWQSTLVACIAGLLTLTLRRNHARARYTLWLAASIKFLVPFSLLMVLGAHLASLRPASPQHHAAADSLLTIEQIDQPFTFAPDFDATPRSAAPAAAPSIPARLAALWNRGPLLPAALAAAWLIGFLAVCVRWTMRWRRISAAIQLTTPLRQGREFEILQRMQRIAGLQRSIELRPLPASMEPGIFGLFRPVLLWPQAITERLEDTHLEAVLAHEVCHVRRRDNLTAAIHMLVEALFWFHPLVWWLETRLVAERENACDEEVLSLCGHRRIYAESILKVCEFCVETPLACVSGVTGADLKRRIAQILADRTALKLTLAKKLLLTATAIMVVAVPLVLGQASAAQRIMLAAINSAPKPLHLAAHALMPIVDTPSTDFIAEMQPPSGSDAGLPQGQAGAKPFKFDVVSIRPSNPNNHGGRALPGLRLTGDGLQISNMSLSIMLSSAYVQQLQAVSGRILGLPDWAKTQAFDVQLKVGDSDIAEWGKLSHDARGPARERRNQSLLLLLTEQFKLKTHSETRDEPLYALVIAKGGPKLKPSTSVEPPTLAMKSPGQLSYIGTPMETVAMMCAQMTGRKVVDKTGLTGKYDFSLDWTAYNSPAAGAPGSEPDASQPPVFTVLQEQLGLKLESQKGPVEYIVVDHAEKPEPMDRTEVAPQADRPTQVDLAAKILAPPAISGALEVPALEVVSVKLNKGSDGYSSMGVTADGLIVTGTPLLFIIQAAFAGHFSNGTTVGLPSWEMDRYDITGKVNDADLDKMRNLSQQQKMAMTRAMLQRVLVDRFQMKFHDEDKDGPVYELVTATNASLLREATPDEITLAKVRIDQMGTIKGPLSLKELADALSGPITGRVVLDKTGLTSKYDLALTWTPNNVGPSNGAAPADTSGPSIFTAVQEQLGLKLRPARGPVKGLVIDHIERPSEN